MDLAGSDPPEDAFAAALAALPGMGTARLTGLLAGASPSVLWNRVSLGQLGPGRPPCEGQGSLGIGPGSAPVDWRRVAERFDVAARWQAMSAAGIGVTWPGCPEFPTALDEDPSPVGVVFYRGDLGVLERAAVAVVGTRRATPDGCRTAGELGRGLAAAGVAVVSGLALGIDAAAHRGVVASRSTPPVAVVASGVDVIYPPRNAELWEQVATSGLLLSETVPGHPAAAWRFPARNRLIAALARLVVVVESHERGGSMLTVEAALTRGKDVLAVPGPVRSPASAGSNHLLKEGAGVVRHAGDVLDALGMFGLWQGAEVRQAKANLAGQALDPELTRVLEAIGWRPVSIGVILEAVGLPLPSVSAALARLQVAGRIESHAGFWQRTA
jgi:DNA processing protein